MNPHNQNNQLNERSSVEFGEGPSQIPMYSKYNQGEKATSNQGFQNQRLNTHLSNPSQINIQALEQQYQQPDNKKENGKQDIVAPPREAVLIQKKIKVLQNNAQYFQAQSHPLFVQNSQLKDQLIEINEMLRQRTKDYLSLSQELNPKGESRELSKKIGDLQTAYHMLKEDIGTYNYTIEIITVQKRDLQKKNIQLNELLTDTNKKFQRRIELLVLNYENKIKGLESKIDNQGRVIEELQNDLKFERQEKQRITETQNREISVLNLQISSLKEQLRNQEMDYQQQLQNIENLMNIMKEQFNQEKREMAQRHEFATNRLKETYETKYNSTVEEYEAKLRIAREDQKLKQDLIDHLKRELELLKQLTSQEIADLKEQLRLALEEIEERKRRIDQLQAENILLKRVNEQLLEEKRQNLEEINRLRDHIRHLEIQFNDYQSKNDQDLSDYLKKIQDLEEAKAQLDRDWREKYDNEVINHVMILRKTVNEITEKYQEMLRKLRLEMDQALNNLDMDRGEMIKNLQEKVAMLEEENNRLQRKLEQTTREWTNKYQELDDRMKRKIQENEIFFKRKLEESDEIRRRDLVDLDQLRKEQLEDLQKKQNEEHQEYRVFSQQQYQEMEDQLKREINDTTDMWTKRYNDMEAILQERIRELELELQRQIKDLEERKQREIQELKQFYQDELRRLKMKLEGNSKGIVDELNAIHQREINELKTLYENQIKTLIQEWENKLKKQAEQYEQKMKDLNDIIDNLKKQTEKLQDEMKRMKDSYQVRIAKLEQEKRELQDLIEELRRRIRELENEVEGLQVQIEKIIIKYEQEVAKLQMEVDRVTKEFQAREKKLHDQFEKEMEKALMEHLQFVEKMKKEFDILLAAHRDRIEELRYEYRELQRLFNDRPSRPDDIRHIQLLMKEIDHFRQQLSDAEVQVLHANEIVQYLQLELQNYKNVYDIFGPNSQQVASDMALIQSSMPNSMENDGHTPLVRNINAMQFQNQGSGKYSRHGGVMNSMHTGSSGIMPPINQNYQQQQQQYYSGGGAGIMASQGNLVSNKNNNQSLENDINSSSGAAGSGGNNGGSGVLNNHNGSYNNANNIQSNVYLSNESDSQSSGLSPGQKKARERFDQGSQSNLLGGSIIDTRYIKLSSNQDPYQKEDGATFVNPFENEAMLQNAEKFVENIKDKDEGSLSQNFVSPIQIQKRINPERENIGSNISGGGSDFSSPVQATRPRRTSSQAMQYQSDYDIQAQREEILNSRHSNRIQKIDHTFTSNSKYDASNDDSQNKISDQSMVFDHKKSMYDPNQQNKKLPDKILTQAIN